MIFNGCREPAALIQRRIALRLASSGSCAARRRSRRPISARFGIGAEVPTIFGVETVAALLLSVPPTQRPQIDNDLEEQADKKIDHCQIFPSREMKTSDTA
jgi:hypothetical protein